MRGIRIVGVALVAAVALGSVAVAGATGHMFKAGKTGELKSTQIGGQLFKAGGGNIECSKLAGKGNVKALEEESQIVTVEYSGCFAYGVKTTFSPIEYEFNANGTASILKAVTITAGGECTITIPKQLKLGKMYYADLSGGKLEIEAVIVGIESTGVGAACGYGTDTKGTYEGNAEAELVGGGSLEWK